MAAKIIEKINLYYFYKKKNKKSIESAIDVWLLSSNFQCQSCNSHHICLLCLIWSDCVLRLKNENKNKKKYYFYKSIFLNEQNDNIKKTIMEILRKVTDK